MWFKTLGTAGIWIAFTLSFLAFVLNNTSVTSSWHLTELMDCKRTEFYNSTVNAWQPIVVTVNVSQPALPDVKLYMQPRMGMCTVANGINVQEEKCYMWDDEAFWDTWDKTVDAGEKGIIDAANLMPQTYNVLVAVTVLSLFSWILIVLNHFKEEYVSRWICQLYIALVSFFSIVIFLYTTVGSTATILVSPEKWQTYYNDHLNGYSCSTLSDVLPYTGVSSAGISLGVSFILFMLVAFPTCCGKCSMLADDDSDMGATQSIIGKSERKSDYIPPVV